jgi:amidase
MPDFDHEAYFHDYLALLTVITSRGQSREERQSAAEELRQRGDAQSAAKASALTLDVPGYLALLTRREEARNAWAAFFEQWDVLLCPTALDSAFPHQIGDQDLRTLTIDGRTVPYQLNIVYPMWAIFPGLPATAFPAGDDPAGLPLGLQAIGPYLEDRTTLRFAQLLEQSWRRFEPPPAYPA